jgi:predicted Zn-dependent protease with MMP-like domain
MFTVDQQKFEELINSALDSLPKKYIKRINNVAIITADSPSAQQRAKLHLHNGQTLFGLYEGIPLTHRGAGYNLVLPDIITIFKLPIERSVNSLDELSEAIKHTLWHEIAHYFGLDHDRIYKLDGTVT